MVAYVSVPIECCLDNGCSDTLARLLVRSNDLTGPLDPTLAEVIVDTKLYRVEILPQIDRGCPGKNDILGAKLYVVIFRFG